MSAVEDLVAGKFYWVMPVSDPDKEAEWEDGFQPARFNGRNADGVPVWNCLGIDGNSDWPMRWIGAEIAPNKGCRNHEGENWGQCGVEFAFRDDAARLAGKDGV